MTAAALSNELKSVLSRAGVDDPSGDASLIMESVLGCTHTQLIVRMREDISDDLRARAVDMARRRATGEPIQYVLGRWSFMGREYSVGKGVLIPRDDTEVVVRSAAEMLKGVEKPLIIDLCSGTGIIAITLADIFKGSTVYAVEKSPEAFAYLSRNISENETDVRAIHSDLRDCADSFADGSADLIISNPPYVPTAEMDGLQKEVQFEPAMALDGGEKGLDLYPVIVDLWSKKLKKGGVIAFEIGEEQYAIIKDMLMSAGFTDVRGYEDIAGTIRAVTAVYYPPSFRQ